MKEMVINLTDCGTESTKVSFEQADEIKEIDAELGFLLVT